MFVSVIIPCFNEKQTLKKILQKVQNSQINIKEIIIVDDCSTDGTIQILKSIQDPLIKIFFHSKNKGKGAALRTGFSKATGDICLVQDADLEYDPDDYPRLIKPIIEDKADVVFGSRFQGGSPHRVVYFWHRIGNGILTLFSNILTDLDLSDMETCYKVFRER